ncbi:MAG: glycosyl hydrolase 53 family protein [Lachnospiraceae bacterium]|nr:glycosyl hydrolase 53 family protein [Lachnospiraceae bacterium]
MKYYKGMDISTLLEVEKCGGKFYDKGEEREVLSILKDYDVNAVRIRLWNDPYSEDGEPYGAGTNDFASVVELSKRAREKGFDILLDYHYSDFWADPGKQFVPKAWKGYSVSELEQAVYDYTKETLLALKAEGLLPNMVQVGNELSNGLLWPYGKVPEYDNIARFVSAGIRAVKEVSDGALAEGIISEKILIMIHLDNGGNNALYREWFDNYVKRGEDFDIIGLSYYPFWHGSFDMLQNNMHDIAQRFGKELIIAEVSMGYTMEDYAQYEKLAPEQRKGMATRPALVEKIEYPMTLEGQKAFMEELFRRIASVPEGKGRGYFYWEPAWIPVPGSGWATECSLKYIEDKGPCGNEWANQALFDYDGNALPTWEAVRDYRP